MTRVTGLLKCIPFSLYMRQQDLCLYAIYIYIQVLCAHSVTFFANRLFHFRERLIACNNKISIGMDKFLTTTSYHVVCGSQSQSPTNFFWNPAQPHPFRNQQGNTLTDRGVFYKILIPILPHYNYVYRTTWFYVSGFLFVCVSVWKVFVCS